MRRDLTVIQTQLNASKKIQEDNDKLRDEIQNLQEQLA